MFDDQPWYFTAAGGALIGMLIGLAVGAGGEDTDKALDARLTALEERITASGEATSSAIGEVAQGNQLLQAEIAVVGTALASGIEQLGQQNAIIGEGQAALGDHVDELATSIVAAADASTAAASAAAAAVAAASQPTAETGASSPADGGSTAEAAPAAASSSLAELIGPDGIVVSPGQTAMVGEGRLFVSRVSDEGVSALVVGGDRVDLSAFGGEVSVGGCTLVLEGIEEGSAFFRPVC